MNIVVKNATVIDHKSTFHLQKKDIYVHEGCISFNKRPGVEYMCFESPNLCVSPGWLDMRAHFCDPGLEHKETLSTGLNAAAFGGYTGVCLMPNTNPVVQSKETVIYLKDTHKNHPVQVFPMGAVSVDCKGEELTEIMDMHSAGAVAFTDGTEPISNSGFLLTALQYVQPFGGLIVQFADDKKISRYGQMNEGPNSTYLGLKGIPNLAEELIIQRDLSLLRYTGGRIHFSRISTQEAVQHIAAAKKEGLDVTADVSVAHLVFTDDALLQYDTNFKIQPPLRSKTDQEALWQGLDNGTIDAVVTDHWPQDEESKQLEFDMADFGITMLETAFPALLAAAPANKLPLLIEKLTYGPKKIIGCPPGTIAEGMEANLTLFDPSITWTYSDENRCSKSKNNPYLGQTLTGKSIAIIRGLSVWTQHKI